jgi:NAD/FAD-utilizing enzyme apparently involved in cell division
MVGDDACSVCASLIQKLLEFIANMEHNKQYRKGMKPPKTPKIKTGKLSKKCFKKLQQAGTSFEYLPVPKKLMPQFETAMKKMGGTFFTGGIEDNNNIYVAIPAAQRNMAALAAQHMLSKEIENKPDAFILKDGNNKISEEEMRITSDVMNSYDIPMFAFRTNDGKYMTVIPKEFEGQFNKAMEDVKQQLEQLKNIEVVRYDQFSPLDKPEKVAYTVTDEEAQELAKVAKLGDLDIQFAKTEQGTAVLYNSDIAEKIEATREDYAKAVSESEAFLIDVTDNTISMDINKLLVPELSDENTYFVRVPNTSGKDYIRLDKSDCEIINGGKSIKTKLDMEKSYSIYDSTGNIKQERSGEELSKSYNTRHPHATKGTKVYEHGQGRERVNLFNKEKNEIISVKLDKADVMRTALKEHGITGKTADMLMEDINKKLSDPQKEVFGFSREKTEVVYADIPNIGEYLAQSQLSQAIVGKACISGEIPKDTGAKCCVLDNNKNEFAVIHVMPVKEVQATLSQMGYSEMSAKEIADKIVGNYREGDVKEFDEVKETPLPKITPFETTNAELQDCGFCKTDDGIMLIRESQDEYKYMTIDKDSFLADVESALHDKFNIIDDISAAVVMKQLIADDIVKTAESKTIGDDVTVSQVTSKYVEISHDGKSEMMPLDKLDTEKLLAMGIPEKTIGDIRKSFEKAEQEVMYPDKQNLASLIGNAKNMLMEKVKAGGEKLKENIKSVRQER